MCGGGKRAVPNQAQISNDVTHTAEVTGSAASTRAFFSSQHDCINYYTKHAVC